MAETRFQRTLLTVLVLVVVVVTAALVSVKVYHARQVSALTAGLKLGAPVATQQTSGTATKPLPKSSSPDKVKPGDPKINLNTATVSDLSRLPGIGPATAKKIVDYRTAHGPFKRIEDVMNIKGIKDKKFQKIKDFITV
jgi:competence protein ComEA